MQGACLFPALVLHRRNQMTRRWGCWESGGREDGLCLLSWRPVQRGGRGPEMDPGGELWRALGVFAVINQPDRKGVNWWWLFPVC